jgi:hypothetical protein
MTLAARILDRLALKPSGEFIDPEQRRRKWIETPQGNVEVWIFDHHLPDAR